MPAVLAIAAHPDDIEYVMAGTLLRLADLGWAVHYFNLSTGNCGSLEMDAETTAFTRLNEARNAAKSLGAAFYPPITKDLEIIYSVPLLREVTAVVRQANPSIILTHAPRDYMEDHMETARLAVTAAFAKNIPNFSSTPSLPGAHGDVAVYHAMPHGLAGPMGEVINPDFYVDTTPTQARKLEALRCHASQQNWLSSSQGMNSYLQAMEDMSLEMGRRSGQFTHAEGWRQHLPLGLSQTKDNPLVDLLTPHGAICPHSTPSSAHS